MTERALEYYFTQMWHDREGRLWAYPPMTFVSPSDARRSHSRALEGGWVLPDMSGAHVSDLYVGGGPKSTILASGGPVQRTERMRYSD